METTITDNKKKIIIGAIAVALAATGAYFWQSGFGAPAARASEVVELKDGDSYTLTAGYVTKEIAGTQQRMLAYNGSIPGPEIHVQQGAQVSIIFKNETDMPQLLHSHGVRMANEYDGSQLQQKDIPPGGSYTYKLKFPDAGVYWYHPHENEVYGQALGLYGAFVVEPKDIGLKGVDRYQPVNREHVLFISDLPIEDGEIAIRKDGTDRALMGHYGNVMLVNGQENYTLAAQKGEVVQLDVVNAAIARPYRFAIAGTKLKLVGGDGGFYQKDQWVDSVVLGPSERAIVDVLFEKAGTYTIENKTPDKTYTLGTITVSDIPVATSYAKEFSELQVHWQTQKFIDGFLQYANKAPDKKLVLSLDLTGMMAGHMQGMGGVGGMGSEEPSDGIEWDENQMMRMMNGMSTAAETKWKITDAATGKSGMDIDWTFPQWTDVEGGAITKPVKIEIYNDPNSMHPMQHPIHFHGNRFLVVSIDGVKQTNLAWKDTVLVPVGAKVEILLDPSNPGTWMAHCHIAEHLVAGMMFTYKVE